MTTEDQGKDLALLDIHEIRHSSQILTRAQIEASIGCGVTVAAIGPCVLTQIGNTLIDNLRITAKPARRNGSCTTAGNIIVNRERQSDYAVGVEETGTTHVVINVFKLCDEIRLSVEFVTVGFLNIRRHSCCH